jgi:hypothetical protein
MRKQIKINENHKKIQDWRKQHPEGLKSECVNELGLNKRTVYKWWDEPFKDPNNRVLTREEVHNTLERIKAAERERQKALYNEQVLKQL